MPELTHFDDQNALVDGFREMAKGRLVVVIAHRCAMACS